MENEARDVLAMFNKEAGLTETDEEDSQILLQGSKKRVSFSTDGLMDSTTDSDTHVDNIQTQPHEANNPNESLSDCSDIDFPLSQNIQPSRYAPTTEDITPVASDGEGDSQGANDGASSESESGQEVNSEAGNSDDDKTGDMQIPEASLVAPAVSTASSHEPDIASSVSTASSSDIAVVAEIPADNITAQDRYVLYIKCLQYSKC